MVRRDINTHRKHFYFTGTVSRPSAGRLYGLEFTVKYRRIGRDWIWADSQSSTNGEIIIQTPSLPDTLSTSFSKFTTTAALEPVRSEVSSTKLWSIEFPTPAAGQDSAIGENLLGNPLYVARWWALTRQWAAWLTPAHGHGVFEVQQDALVCSFQCRDGLHLVLLGISGIDNVQTVFRDDGFGGVVVHARNDQLDSKPARVLAAIGFTHDTALAACIYAARNMIQRGSYSSLNAERSATKDDLLTNWYSSWSDGLGYCTWNGIGKDLSQDKISKALRTLRENNIKIQTLIIDDNWQSLDTSNSDHHYHTWSEFEAGKEGFPRGLGVAVATIREQNPALQHVAVWHAMFGYWGGITPDGPIAKRYKTTQICRSETGRRGFEAAKLTVVTGDEIQRLFEDFYTFLSNAGIDGVKTDAQMMLDLVADPEDRRTIIQAYQDAWNLVGLENFQNKMISCMSHTPDIIFHSLLPSSRPAITLRNSDDFWPNIPDSHTWHVFVNAHNALFTQYLNVLPDWDMFQTTHEFASFHAAARCVSGGPIYITDEPGKHDFDLIKQMTAETVHGSTIILRPSCLARAATSSIYISNAEPRLLKIANYHGRATTGTGILGLFNCTKGPLLDMVRLDDFRGIREDQRYIIRSFTSGQSSDYMTLDSELSSIMIDLAVRGWDILTSYPVWSFSRDDKTIDFALLGLVEKMSGAAALLEYGIDPNQGQRCKISVVLKALGVLGKCHPDLQNAGLIGQGIYISDLDKRTVEDDFIIMISESIIPITTVGIAGNVLQIDLEAAWKSIDEPAARSNEVRVDIYMAWVSIVM